ncbi:MAG TPA: glycosyltransferase family 2 protein [Erysipelotrichaceae bacterium]|nr:glycosyltransferase family 2 protein [Erysipelotrichaceae bacterium]
MAKLSIIIPVYFNEMNLYDLYDDLKEKVLGKLDQYELVFVDDGSLDQSFSILKDIQSKDSNVMVVKLSRNFGSHAAILAGLIHSTGDCAVMKTADLQEPSSMLLEMFQKWKDGNNVVLAIRKDRQEPWLQIFFSNLYYKLMRRIAIKTMPDGGFDCFLIDRKVIKVLEMMDEKNSTIMGQILWAGFKTDMIYYTRLKREKGKSRWTLSKKIKLFVDSILAFSYFPIRFISTMGILTFFGTIIWLLYILYAKFFIGIEVEGWTTLMITSLFFYGLILLTLGIIGEYLWRAFDAARQRPSFIIEELIEPKGAKHE